MENNRGNIISDGFQMAESCMSISAQFLPQKISAHFQYRLLILRVINQIIYGSYL